MTRFIFITGGVVSSLGKGISSASLAALLEARGLKIAMLKLDPYINVDPGTMSPTMKDLSVLKQVKATTLLPGVSTKRSYLTNAAEITLAQPFRSYRILLMKFVAVF